MLRPVALSANGTLLNPVYALLLPVAVAVYELRIRLMHVLLAIGKLFAVTGPLIAEGNIKGLRNFFNGAVTKEAVSSGGILLWMHEPPSYLALVRLVPTDGAFDIPRARYTEKAVSSDVPLDRLDTFLAGCGEPLNHYGPMVKGPLPRANLLAKGTTERRNSLSRDLDPHLRGQTRIVHMTRSLLEYAQCTMKGETRSNTS